MMEILIGMIGSGKSDYAKKRAAHGAIIVNDDAIVAALHGGDDKLYAKGLKPLYKHVEHAIMSMAMSFGRDVVIDRPCLKRLTRARYIGVARAYDTPVRAVLFSMGTPGVHATRRFSHDPRGHTFDAWLEAATRQSSEYELPTTNEGFDDIVTPPQALELAKHIQA